MSNIEYRLVIKFFTRKGLNATEISKELDSVYKDDTASHCTIAKWLAQFREPKRGFEDSPRTGRPSTIAIHQNIKVVERIVTPVRQISVRRLAYELPIPTTTVYEIVSNHLGMKKISTRRVPKLLTSIQHANSVVCCQELLEESEVNSGNYFHRTVIGDEIWIYYWVDAKVSADFLKNVFKPCSATMDAWFSCI